MPIRCELRALYPPHWRELSRRIRFERAFGKCQHCGRPHLALVNCLPDGRWFDAAAATWRDRRGRVARWPDLVEATRFRTTRVVLATAHLDGNPRNNGLRNLRALCQRCHMLHDKPYHLAQRWLTYRRRLAVGDLFLGSYAGPIAALPGKRTGRTYPRPALKLLLLTKKRAQNGGDVRHDITLLPGMVADVGKPRIDLLAHLHPHPFATT